MEGVCECQRVRVRVTNTVTVGATGRLCKCNDYILRHMDDY